MIQDINLKLVKSETTGAVKYEGFAVGYTADPAQPVWTIRRTAYEGGVFTEMWANFGRAVSTWDDRASYFPPPPIGGFPENIVTILNSNGQAFSPTNPLYVFPVESAGGSPFFADSSGTSTPGAEFELINFAAPTGVSRNIESVTVTCSIAGKFTVYAGDDTIGSGRLTPAVQTVSFQFKPARPIDGGDVVRVTYESSPDRPAAPVEAYLMASDLSI